MFLKQHLMSLYLLKKVSCQERTSFQFFFNHLNEIDEEARNEGGENTCISK